MQLLHPPGLCQRLRNPGRKMRELLKQFSVWEKRLETWLGKNMTINAFSLIWNWIVVDPHSDFRVSKNDNWEKLGGEVIRRNTSHIGQLWPLRSSRLRGELEEFESWGKTSTLGIFSILPVQLAAHLGEGGRWSPFMEVVLGKKSREKPRPMENIVKAANNTWPLETALV